MFNCYEAHVCTLVYKIHGKKTPHKFTAVIDVAGAQMMYLLNPSSREKAISVATTLDSTVTHNLKVRDGRDLVRLKWCAHMQADFIFEDLMLSTFSTHLKYSSRCDAGIWAKVSIITSSRTSSAVTSCFHLRSPSSHRALSGTRQRRTRRRRWRTT